MRPFTTASLNAATNAFTIQITDIYIQIQTGHKHVL